MLIIFSQTVSLTDYDSDTAVTVGWALKEVAHADLAKRYLA